MESYQKSKQIKKFDPNGVGQKGKLFGLPFDLETSEVVVIPVPWDVTASFHDGASLAPQAILDVSPQIDLYIPSIPDAWKLGISMLPIDNGWIEKNKQARIFAKEYIRHLEEGSVKLNDKEVNIILKNINALSENINQWVYDRSKLILDKGKIPAVFGGDHSSPYGLMKAIAESNDNFGVLQIDAHADLRPAYEGFVYSHASIMYNLLSFDSLSTLVQVGVRDICEQEAGLMEDDGRIITFYDHDIHRKLFEHVSWREQVNEIVEALPDNIYITIDIDGLKQHFCPSTGTPVPGGLDYNQVIYLLYRIVESGKKIVGFDICEVSVKNSDWDAIVGSRLLYYLANITGVSQKLLAMS